MGTKNRQGCCCGSKVITCDDGCFVCGDGSPYYGATGSAYFKNGVVSDANGDHELLQPNPSNGLAWRTKPIKFTTSRWTDGDCTIRTGDAYYAYRFACGLPAGENGGAFVVGLLTAAKQCAGGAWLYYDNQAEIAQVAATVISGSQIQCDPFSATFDLGSFHGLDTPWAGATVTFDDDLAAEHKCACRICALYPDGDVVLSYNIDDVDGEPKSGSLRLVRSPRVSQGDYIWTGNVDWWDKPSCTNPTNDPSGHNVELACNGFSFLKWCGFNPPGQDRVLAVATSAPGDVRFNLISSTGDNDGLAKIKDAPDAGQKPGDVCCYPCDIPAKDVHFTLFVTSDPNPVPDLCPNVIAQLPNGTVFDGTLAYSSEPMTISGTAGLGDPGGMFTSHHKMKATVPGPIRGWAAGDYVIWLVCADVSGGWGIVFGQRRFGVDPTGGEFLQFKGIGTTGNSTCSPLHIEMVGKGGGSYCLSTPPPPAAIASFTFTTTAYIDEIS